MHKVKWHGRTKSIADWIEEHGADRGIVLMRLTAGWQLDRAITAPLGKPKHVRRGKTTPWRGVRKRSDRVGYRVRGKLNGKLIQVGTFACDKEAAAAYNIWARTHLGLRAKVNVV